MSSNSQTTIQSPPAKKLTKLQLATLSAAYQHDDRLVALGEDGGVSATNAVTALLRRGLLAEVPAREGQPFWRRDDENRLIGAVITQAGLAALRIAGVVTTAQELERVEEITSAAPEKQSSDQPSPSVCRPGTKRALIIELLRRSDGASLDELVAATGWLPHTSRAALTGLRHKGFVLE
jgi:hypothetical protein